MYLHKRVFAIITLRRMFEIAYVQNFISSPVIKQKIHLIFFHNPLFIYKMQFLSSKTAWSVSLCNCRASTLFMMTSYWQVHCDHIFASNLLWRIFRAINIHLIVSTYHFVLSSTPLYDLELLILSFSKFSHVVIFMWCHSQHFLIRLGPAPL